MNKFQFLWVYSGVILVLLSCGSKNAAIPQVYEGPLTEADGVEMLYTEHDQIKLKMKARKINELVSGDQEFPEGIYIEFYDPKGNLTSTLSANDAYYFKQEKKWRGRGKVEVKNLEKKQQLNTEELFWKPDTKKISTEKFVTIKLENEVLYGIGLEAVEDLTFYEIKQPQGEFDIRE